MEYGKNIAKIFHKLLKIAENYSAYHVNQASF